MSRTLCAASVLAAGACLLVPGIAPAADDRPAADYHGAFYYAGETSNLSGSTYAYGVDLKEDAVTSAGSRTGLYLLWGPEWYKMIGIDLHSTGSLVPKDFGTDVGERKMALSSIQALLGNSSGWIPSLYYDWVTFGAIAVANGDYPVVDQGRPLAPGDEFPMSITRQLFLLSWKATSDNKPLELTASSVGIFVGIGMARLDFAGLRLDETAHVKNVRTIYGSGPAVCIKLRYGALPVSDATKVYFQANGEVAATKYGGIIKAGYELGVIHNANGLLLRPYVGGYFWPARNWASSIGFEGLQTDAGWTGGLQLELVW